MFQKLISPVSFYFFNVATKKFKLHIVHFISIGRWVLLCKESIPMLVSFPHRQASRDHDSHPLPPVKAMSSIPLFNKYLQCLVLCKTLEIQGAKPDTIFWTLLSAGMDRHFNTFTNKSKTAVVQVW